MDRRSYLAGLATASTTGFAVLAGCSGTDGGNGSGNGEGTDSGSGDPGTDAAAGSGADTGATEGEALETGQEPPEETATPFDETETLPEEEGLETGQAPNATDS
ncbi:hypothetical protein [Halococcus thailandensis]|nr:hypothetical protein [Halococcus thailandensis]